MYKLFIFFLLVFLCHFTYVHMRQLCQHFSTHQNINLSFTVISNILSFNLKEWINIKNDRWIQFKNVELNWKDHSPNSTPHDFLSIELDKHLKRIVNRINVFKISNPQHFTTFVLNWKKHFFQMKSRLIRFLSLTQWGLFFSMLTTYILF